MYIASDLSPCTWYSTRGVHTGSPNPRRMLRVALVLCWSASACAGGLVVQRRFLSKGSLQLGREHLPVVIRNQSTPPTEFDAYAPPRDGAAVAYRWRTCCCLQEDEVAQLHQHRLHPRSRSMWGLLGGFHRDGGDRSNVHQHWNRGPATAGIVCRAHGRLLSRLWLRMRRWLPELRMGMARWTEGQALRCAPCLVVLQWPAANQSREGSPDTLGWAGQLHAQR